MLDKLMGSRIRAKLLGWLFTHTDQRYFVRQLTSLLGEDSTNLSRELSKLQNLGILTSTFEGRQKYFQANPDSPVLNELKGLAVKTVGVAGQLKNALEPISVKISAAFLYGSFADNRFDSGSDIDLAVISEIPSKEVNRALGKARKTLGREINLVVFTPAEFEKKATGGHHFVNSLVKTTKIFIIGGENDLKAITQGKPNQAS